MIKYFLAEDTIDKKDIRSLIGWLKKNPRLTKGPLTLQFEEKWSQWLGSRHSVFCNSGSSANLLMYEAIKHGTKLRNNKVVVPAVGWVTSLAPAMQLGFKPLICEADPDTFGLDLNHLESLLKKHRPATVFLVHVLGVPHKMKEMMFLKRKYNFFLLEDACAAIGAASGGKNVGSFGDAGSFSFYFGHQMSTIEGGMVSTPHKKIQNALLMLRSHGWSKDLDRNEHKRLVRRHGINDFHSPFVFYIPGYNLRSTDLNAYLGLGQLKKLSWIISRRQENHARYMKNLGHHLIHQKARPSDIISSISFGGLAHSTQQRQKIVASLVQNKIETRIFSAGNLGLHPFWYEKFGKTHFPMADKIHSQGFFLPNSPSISLKDVDFISDVVLKAL